MKWNWQHSNQVVSEPVGKPVVHFVKFIIEKGKFYRRFHGQLNDRQLKVVERMFSEGINGFKGGLSAKNYRVITGAPSATTTRDLSRMVELGCLY